VQQFRHVQAFSYQRAKVGELAAKFAETVRNFTAQQHTKLSFTDIAIATVALKRSDGLVLTFDEEFRKLPAIRLAE
jgi:predicted nucleic acid-binding protein